MYYAFELWRALRLTATIREIIVFLVPLQQSDSFAGLKLSTELFAQLSPLEFAHVSCFFFINPCLRIFYEKIVEKLQRCASSERIQSDSEDKGKSRKKCDKGGFEQLSIVTSDRFAIVGTNFTKGSFQPSRLLHIRF